LERFWFAALCFQEDTSKLPGSSGPKSRNRQLSWELALKKVVAPLVQRYGNKLHPGGLRKLVMINETDYTDFKASYDFCCTYCHTDAAAVNRPAPTPDQLRSEVRSARDWLKTVQSRQNKNP
jgi:hypothetical protein